MVLAGVIMRALLNYVVYSLVALAGWRLLTARMARNRPLGAVALAASVVVAWVTWRYTSDWLFGDFLQAYWPAGASFWREGPDLRELTSRGVRGYVNLPIVAVLFLPLGWMDSHTAAQVFTLAGIASAIAAWWLLAAVAGLDVPRRWLLLYLFAANGPLVYSVEFGNTSHIVLLALVGVMCLWQTRPLAAGMLLGVAALIKLPLVLLAAFLFLRRQWAMLAGSAAVLAASTALSIAWFGWDLHVLWYQQSVQPFFGGSMPAYNVQTVPAFMTRLQTAGAGLRLWEPVMLGPAMRAAAGVSTGALLLIAFLPSVLRRARASSMPPRTVLDLEFATALVCCVIASTLAWSHYYVWMLVPMALLLANPVVARDRLARGLAIAGTWLVSLPVFPVYLDDGPFKDAFTRTAASYLLLGGVLLVGALARTRWLAGAAEESVSGVPAGRPGR